MRQVCASAGGRCERVEGSVRLRRAGECRRVGVRAGGWPCTRGG